MKKIGHIYVAMLAGGIVKVGHTSQPKHRISKSGFGNREILSCWLSDMIIDCRSAESKLISIMNDFGTLEFGKEYFSGISYDHAVELAMSVSCEYQKASGNEKTNRDTSEVTAVLDKIHSHFTPKESDPRWAEHVKSCSHMSMIPWRMMINSGVKSYFLDEVDYLGGASLFSYSLILTSYIVDDDAANYFSNVCIDVAMALSSAHVDIELWLIDFMSNQKNDINMAFIDHNAAK